MGATYYPDINDKVTHVIAAFPNTEKVMIARSKGCVILGSEWIYNCANTKTRVDDATYRI
jgi:hypothetical protein